MMKVYHEERIVHNAEIVRKSWSCLSPLHTVLKNIKRDVKINEKIRLRSPFQIYVQTEQFWGKNEKDIKLNILFDSNSSRQTFIFFKTYFVERGGYRILMCKFPLLHFLSTPKQQEFSFLLLFSCFCFFLFPTFQLAHFVDLRWVRLVVPLLTINVNIALSYHSTPLHRA